MTFLTLQVDGARSSSAAKSVGLLVLAAFVTLALALVFGGRADSAVSAQATVDLGNADSFGALSFAAMTNSGANTVVHGDIGSSTSIDSGRDPPRIRRLWRRLA